MNHPLRDTGMPIVAMATRGARSGKLRKNPVMRTAARMPSLPPRAARTNTARPNPAATAS